MRALLLLLLICVSASASAEVRRCQSDDGVTIYTDQPCAHFHAQEVRPQPVAPSVGNITAAAAAEREGPIRTDCSRTPDAFLFDLRRALEYGNVNALAGLYHWPDASGSRWIMDNLERLARESGGTADLVYPDAAFVVSNPDAYPGLPPEDPEAVQIGPEGSGARLSLVRYAGCWWLRF
jgi:hypothetical protein